MTRNRLPGYAPILAGFALLSGPVFGDELFQSEVRPILEQYCYKCHSEQKVEGGLQLDNLGTDFLQHQDAEKWVEVMDNINLEEMPPFDEEAQPTIQQRIVVTDWITEQLREAQRVANSSNGRVLLRRLSRTEYENTVRDLLGVTFQPKQTPIDLLPPDGTFEGFDRVSSALLIDPSLMDKYLEMGATIADRAVQLGPPPIPTVRSRIEYEEYYEGEDSLSMEVVEDGVAFTDGQLRSFARLKHPYNNQMIPVAARYAVRLKAGIDRRGSDEPVYVSVSRDADGTIWEGKVTAPASDPEVIEVIREFPVAGGEIKTTFVNGTGTGTGNRRYLDLSEEQSKLIKEGKVREGTRYLARKELEGHYGQGAIRPEVLERETWPRLFVDYIEIEGPLYEAWPPKSTEEIFFEGTDPNLFGEEYATRIFERLLPRAYRRPTEPADLERIMGVYRAETEQGRSFPEAVKAGLITMLSTPSFLFIAEPAGDTPEKLNDYELASRLSYFLWSSMPDEELFDLAAAGKLTDPKVLSGQVQRMLDDPKADALVEGFAAQWLKAKDFDRFRPDERLYPRFYETEFSGLNEDINREPLEVFREMLHNDLDVRDLLDSDWTMLNERLANFYEIEADVKGDEFIKVSLPDDSPRGGLVGMAAVHKWGSDGNRTKPVDRGKYILEVLFNDPPGIPPPNVGEVEPNVKGKNLTVRERLEKHREIESCRACHSRIDPYGLALENFNVIGTWRDQQDGEGGNWGKEPPAIDASGTLPNGTSFDNIHDFKTALRGQSDRFLRGLSEKLFVYALGRPVEPSDRETLDEMVLALQENDHTLRSVIAQLVESEAFQTK